MAVKSCKDYGDAIDAVIANGDYDHPPSTDKAYAFLQSIRIALALRPESVRAGGPSGENLEFTHAALVALRDECKAWLSRKRISTSPAFGYLDTGCIDR